MNPIIDKHYIDTSAENIVNQQREINRLLYIVDRAKYLCKIGILKEVEQPKKI